MTISDTMKTFLRQNPLCGAGMSFEQIELADAHDLAREHSGNLIVLQGAITEGTSEPTTIVKMHDSWGAEYEAVVHSYDPNAEDPDSDGTDHVEGYEDPKKAAEDFFELLSIERVSA